MGRFISADEFTGGPETFEGEDEWPESNALPYADIENPQSLNKYQYAYNNPLLFIDPDGHAAAAAVPVLEPEPAPTPEPQVIDLEPLATVALGYYEVKLGTELYQTIKAINSENDSYAQQMKAEGKLNQILLQKQKQKPAVAPKPNVVPAPKAAEHTKRKSSDTHTNDKHTKVRPGTKQPPNYKPHRKFKQPKNRKDGDN
jgi:hypothetical protein